MSDYYDDDDAEISEWQCPDCQNKYPKSWKCLYKYENGTICGLCKDHCCPVKHDEYDESVAGHRHGEEG